MLSYIYATFNVGSILGVAVTPPLVRPRGLVLPSIRIRCRLCLCRPFCFYLSRGHESMPDRLLTCSGNLPPFSPVRLTSFRFLEQTAAYGWKAAFIIFGVFGLVVALCAHFVVPKAHVRATLAGSHATPVDLGRAFLRSLPMKRSMLLRLLVWCCRWLSTLAPSGSLASPPVSIALRCARFRHADTQASIVPGSESAVVPEKVAAGRGEVEADGAEGEEATGPAQSILKSFRIDQVRPFAPRRAPCRYRRLYHEIATLLSLPEIKSCDSLHHPCAASLDAIA